METTDYTTHAIEMVLDLLGRGMTVRDIAKASKLDPGTITRILDGREITARTYARLRAYHRTQEETMTTDTTNIRIVPVEGEMDALYARYDGQSQRQDVYLYVDLDDAEMAVRYNPEIGNAVTMDVWHGRTIRYRLCGIPTPEVANELMTEVLPLAQRMLAGYESVWDGSNWVGRLITDDARAADEELTALCESTEYGADNRNGVDEWDAGDWCSDNPPESLGLRAGMTDEELEAAERALREQALRDNVVLYGLTYRLRSLRDRLGDED